MHGTTGFVKQPSCAKKIIRKVKLAEKKKTDLGSRKQFTGKTEKHMVFTLVDK